MNHVSNLEQRAPFEARTNADGSWRACNAWSVLARVETSYGPAEVRHTYNVRTPGEALAVFRREQADREGLGEPVRIIPDPMAYTQQIRILPTALDGLDAALRELLGIEAA